MSQDEILELVRQRPGILQSEIRKTLTTQHLSDKLRRLRVKGEIVRVSLGKTFAIFPVEGMGT